MTANVTCMIETLSCSASVPPFLHWEINMLARMKMLSVTGEDLPKYEGLVLTRLWKKLQAADVIHSAQNPDRRETNG